MEIPADLKPIKGWKIAFSIDLGYFEVDEEIQAIMRGTVDAFRELGCTVEEVDVGWNFDVLNAQATLWESILFAITRDFYPRWKFEMDRYVRELIERGSQHSAKRLYDTNFVRGSMYQTLGLILENYDVLICPTTALPGLPAEHDILDTDFRINGKPISYANLPGDTYLHWQLSYPFNLIPESRCRCAQRLYQTRPANRHADCWQNL